MPLGAGFSQAPDRGAAVLAAPLLLPRAPSSRVAARLDDQTIAGYAQSIELAAVAAYTAAAPVLSAGTLPVAQLFMATTSSMPTPSAPSPDEGRDRTEQT